MAGIVFGCLSPHPPLIVPGVADKEREIVAATETALKELKNLLAASRPQSAVIVSPHSRYIENNAMGVSVATKSQGDFNEWGIVTPKVKFDNDIDLAALILKDAKEAKIPVKPLAELGYELDHGVMVPIHFLKEAMKGVQLLPLTFCWLPLKTHYSFGKVIGAAAKKSQKRVAFIASGDLSHHLKGSGYGHDAMGEVFDETLVKALSSFETNKILNLDPEMIERAGECGLRSVVIMLGALEGLQVKPRILSYEGPFGVGYAVVAFEVQ
jgi:AmmeMemoRadiSam system protein B